jgi:hypothetical protein
MDLRAALSALYIDRRDDTCPVDGEHKARKLVERTVLRVGHGEELGIGRRAARRNGLEKCVRGWAGEGGCDGGC